MPLSKTDLDALKAEAADLVSSINALEPDVEPNPTQVALDEALARNAQLESENAALAQQRDTLLGQVATLRADIDAIDAADKAADKADDDAIANAKAHAAQ